MKFLSYILILLTFIAFPHKAAKGDLEGAWVLVETSWNGEFFEVESPLPVKLYAYGNVIYTYYEDGKLGVGHGEYIMDKGLVSETITNHSNLDLIGQSFSYEPNFMGDKKSFIQTIDFNGNELFERWKKTSCNVENCYLLSSKPD